MASSDDVSDPTDWLATSLSSFSTLESALRCQVCKEFYDTPMITSCSHTFCSLCIRRCLSSDGKCPTCRAEDQSSKLRRNWAVQECVDVFVKARPQALELATKRKQEDEEQPKKKRRRLSHDIGPSQLPSRQTRSSTRQGSQNAAPPTHEVIAIDSENDDDGEYIEAEPLSEPIEPNDGLVACPMCSRRMKEEAVYNHLDRCDGKPSPPPVLKNPSVSKLPRTKSRTGSPAKHLPHLNYSLLKDAALKNKLKDLGIPTFGSRQLMIRRHTQWVDIYNANSDSEQPRSERLLLKDLDLWERTQGGHAPGQGQNGPTGVMRKDFDGNDWSRKHGDQFGDLIAKARAKAKAKAAEGEKKESGGGDAMDGVERHLLTNGQPPAHMDASSKTPTMPHSISETQDITDSPVASMLHSAAQDVRRRSSTSQSSTPLQIPASGFVTKQPLPQASLQSSPSNKLTCNEISKVMDLPKEESLGEKLAAAASQSVTDEEGAKMKTLDMFRMPENPVHDVEGLGAADGDG